MNKSESIVNLSKSIITVQGKFKTLSKNANNPYFTSKYTPLDEIWENIRPLLAEHGLAVLQFPSHTGLETVIVHSSGEWMSCDSTWGVDLSNPQKIGSAITYMRRYGLCAVLGIVSADEDDDGNAATGQNKKPTTTKQKNEPEVF